MPLRFQAPEGAARPRLDHFLAAQLPDWSRAKLQRIIRDGGVQVEGVPALRPGFALRPGACVELEPPPPPPAMLEPEDIPLDILFEDNDLVALNKPAGLIVHPGAGRRSGTLVNALLFRYASLSGAGGPARPGIVHRLDRFTSGVMVVARNDWSHQRLAEQFQARTVEKTYFALARGRMPAAAGEIKLAIRRDPHQRVRMTTRGRGGREAHTSFTVRETFGDRYSWLEVRIHTGRTHQIRVHLAALGHPVMGDRLYGAAARETALEEKGLRLDRVMLHAARLRMAHPRTGDPMDFAAPLPAGILDVLASLRAGAAAEAGPLRRL